jgi:hypothetical protein
MKRALIALFCLLLTVACTNQTSFVPPNACVDSDSIILQTIEDPRPLDQGLMAVNLTALETIDGYSIEDAQAVLDTVEDKLAALQTTYAELAGYILARLTEANAAAGAAIFIIGPDIQRLNKPLPITECDIALIRLHLERQRLMLAIYQGSNR